MTRLDHAVEECLLSASPIRVRGGGGLMANLPNFTSSVCGSCSRMLALVLSALIASIAGAAPVPFDRVQELAGGIASSVQVSYVVSLHISSPIHFFNKGTGVVNSGGLLSCAFKQQ